MDRAVLRGVYGYHQSDLQIIAKVQVKGTSFHQPFSIWLTSLADLRDTEMLQMQRYPPY